MIGKSSLYIGKSPSEARPLMGVCFSFEKQLIVGGIGGGGGTCAALGKFVIFFSHLSLETVFPALKLTKYCRTFENPKITFLS